MLAVLILSAITAIVFSMATIVFIEIRTAGDAQRTEPALYATLGVTEEALYQYRRNLPSGNSVFDISRCSPSSSNPCSLNGVNMEPEEIFEDEIPRVQTIRPRQLTLIPLYTAQSFVPSYGRVKVSVLDTNNNSKVTVSVRQTTFQNVQTDHGTDTIDSNDTFNFASFSSNSQYDIVLDNSQNNEAVTVSIETFALDESTEKGLPIVGEKLFKIRANYQGLTRTYRVRIPE